MLHQISKTKVLMMTNLHRLSNEKSVKMIVMIKTTHLRISAATCTLAKMTAAVITQTASEAFTD